MKIILPILTALITGVVAFFLFQKNSSEQELNYKLQKLKVIEASVQKNLDDISDKVFNQLKSFSQTVSEDKNFALRLLAENDRSSADVTELAVRFKAPMGFSVLEITDSSLVILSSGHFPANAGNSAVEKAKITDTPICFDDNIMGQHRLTLQSKVKFQISDISFYAMGGLEINGQFLKAISPNQDITILLKRGKEYLGKDDIRSISEVTNNRILINDKECYASELQLPYTGEGLQPSLIIVME